ncbi:MAG: hypothetical protein HWN67_18970 [Candidatus Helarchaeota archaeon]|nr:hypothetical protein [Candidatus Helarchaeota archaeon]
MDVSSKSCFLLFLGVPLTIMGVVSSIMFRITNIPGPMSIPFTVIPIIWICVGSILIIIAISISVRESKSFDEFAKIASESSDSEERTEISTQEPRAELSDLICPGCGAPLKSRPPCICEYCGRLIN